MNIGIECRAVDLNLKEKSVVVVDKCPSHPLFEQDERIQLLLSTVNMYGCSSNN